LELVLILERMGTTCVPGPYLYSNLGTLAVLDGGVSELKKELLPRVATGEVKLSLAYLEADAPVYEPEYVSTTANAKDGTFTLNGTKQFVPYANSVDYLVVTARTKGEKRSQAGVSLFLVPTTDPGIELIPLKTTAGDKQFEVSFHNVSVGEKHLLGEIHEGYRLFDKLHKIGAVAKCAEMVGGAERVLGMTVDYAKERAQFGSLIGKFQAVQHHCANMAMDLHGSRYITYKAAWMLAEGLECDLQVASAKGWISEAYKRISALGHQIGAATAYIVEHDMTLFSRRAKGAEIAFGDAAYHRQLVARAMEL
jgi:3-oxocholest-4-en-26-oyl-CoA dehydrogenase beta subunit